MKKKRMRGVGGRGIEKEGEKDLGLGQQASDLYAMYILLDIQIQQRMIVISPGKQSALQKHV